VNDDHHNGCANEKDSEARVEARPEDSNQKDCYRQQSQGSNCDENVHAFVEYRFWRSLGTITVDEFRSVARKKMLERVKIAPAAEKDASPPAIGGQSR
jgi:hypothetical protein